MSPLSLALSVLHVPAPTITLSTEGCKLGIMPMPATFPKRRKGQHGEPAAAVIITAVATQGSQPMLMVDTATKRQYTQSSRNAIREAASDAIRATNSDPSAVSQWNSLG